MRSVQKSLEAASYLAGLLLFTALLYLLPHPEGLYAAAIAAGAAGALAASPLRGAVVSGLAGLTAYLALLALIRVPGYLAGLAGIIGWAAVAAGLLYSLLAPAGFAVVAWHAARSLRGRGGSKG